MDPDLDPQPDVRPGPERGLDAEMNTDVLIGKAVIAIGADLVDIDRLRVVMSRQAGFADRVFTMDERAYCDRRNDPAERYAARFAAKEAVLKVLGTGLGGADFSDIEVIRHDNGKPELRISGRAEAKATEMGIRSWLITMSHSDDVAQVFVAGLGEPGETST